MVDTTLEPPCLLSIHPPVPILFRSALPPAAPRPRNPPCPYPSTAPQITFGIEVGVAAPPIPLSPLYLLPLCYPSSPVSVVTRETLIRYPSVAVPLDLVRVAVGCISPSQKRPATAFSMLPSERALTNHRAFSRREGKGEVISSFWVFRNKLHPWMDDNKNRQCQFGFSVSFTRYFPPLLLINALNQLFSTSKALILVLLMRSNSHASSGSFDFFLMKTPLCSGTACGSLTN